MFNRLTILFLIMVMCAFGIPRESRAQSGKLERITVENADQVKELRKLDLKGQIQDVAFSPDGVLVAFARGTDIALLDTSGPDGKLITLVGHTNRIGDIAFSPDGSLLVSCSGSNPKPNDPPADNTVRVWDVKTGKQVLLIKHPGDDLIVRNVTFAAGGAEIISVSSDYSVFHVWDAKTGKLVSQTEVTPLDDAPRIISATFSADGSHYALGGRSGAKLWQRTPALVEVPHQLVFGAHLAFSGDNKFLAAAQRNSAEALILDLTTGKQKTLRAIRDVKFSALALDSRGTLLVETAYRDELFGSDLRFVDVETGEQVARIRPFGTDFISRLVFNPQDTLLVSATSLDGEVRFWGIAR